MLPAIDAAMQAALLAAVFAGSVSRHKALVEISCLLVIPLTQHCLRSFGVYDSHRMEGAAEVIRKIFAAGLVSFGFFLTLSLAVGVPGFSLQVTEFFAAATGALALERLFVYVILRSARRRGFDRRHVCVVGTWEAACGFARRFAERPEWGLSVVCAASGAAESRTYSSFPDGGALAGEFEQVLKARVIDEVLIAVDASQLQAESQAARLYEQYGLLVRVVLGPGERGGYAPVMEEFFGARAMSMVPRLRWEGAMAVKRIFDLVVATVLLVLSAPLMAAIAVLVKLSSPGPVFFRQVRTGMNGRQFRMIKFRTMVDGAESLIRHSHNSITQGPVFKDPNDYRITPAGRYLRRLSLDELPQLFNVLKGEMSMVGPRPPLADEVQQYELDHLRRLDVLLSLIHI